MMLSSVKNLSNRQKLILGFICVLFIYINLDTIVLLAIVSLWLLLVASLLVYAGYLTWLTKFPRLYQSLTYFHPKKPRTIRVDSTSNKSDVNSQFEFDEIVYMHKMLNVSRGRNFSIVDEAVFRPIKNGMAYRARPYIIRGESGVGRIALCQTILEFLKSEKLILDSRSILVDFGDAPDPYSAPSRIQNTIQDNRGYGGLIVANSDLLLNDVSSQYIDVSKEIISVSKQVLASGKSVFFTVSIKGESQNIEQSALYKAMAARGGELIHVMPPNSEQIVDCIEAHLDMVGIILAQCAKDRVTKLLRRIMSSDHENFKYYDSVFNLFSALEKSFFSVEKNKDSASKHLTRSMLPEDFDNAILELR